MTTQMYDQPQEGVVKDMRKIRDQINAEIQHMTFEEERVYLDKLLDNSNMLMLSVPFAAEK